MKIARLATYHAAPRWLFLKIETDEGITGNGECIHGGEGCPAMVHALKAVIHDGADPGEAAKLLG